MYRVYLLAIKAYMERWNECFTLTEIKQTARARRQRDEDERNQRYGWN